MKEIKIVLKGGHKTCCSSYTAPQMLGFTKQWFENYQDIVYSVIDIEDEEWEVGSVADLAYSYFKDSIFPLCYYEKNLVLIGRFPERDELYNIIQNPKTITEKDILEYVESLKKQEKQKIND